MSRSTSPPTPPSTSSTTLPLSVPTTPASSPPPPPSLSLTLPPLPSPPPKFLQPRTKNIIKSVPPVLPLTTRTTIRNHRAAWVRTAINTNYFFTFTYPTATSHNFALATH